MGRAIAGEKEDINQTTDVKCLGVEPSGFSPSVMGECPEALDMLLRTLLKVLLDGGSVPVEGSAMLCGYQKKNIYIK